VGVKTLHNTILARPLSGPFIDKTFRIVVLVLMSIRHKKKIRTTFTAKTRKLLERFVRFAQQRVKIL